MQYEQNGEITKTLDPATPYGDEGIIVGKGAKPQNFEQYLLLAAIAQIREWLAKFGKTGKGVFIFDAGHGGIDQPSSAPPFDYSTFRLYKGKFFDHAQKDSKGKPIIKNGKRVLQTHEGKPAEFHHVGYFYEGVENRIYELALRSTFAPLVANGEICIINSHHPIFDNSLQNRVDIANAIFAEVQAYNKANKTKLFVHFHSLHFNAANTQAQGICIFTSEGQTNSDAVADAIHKELSMHFPNHRLGRTIASVRTQQSADGDPDHEKNFYVLRETKPTATLVELGFFDNFAEACLIKYNSEYKQRVTLSMAHAFARYFGLNLSLLPPMPTGLFSLS